MFQYALVKCEGALKLPVSNITVWFILKASKS